MKFFLILLATFFFFNCSGQHKKANSNSTKTDNKMEIIYTKKFDEVLLTFIRSIDDKKIEWKTILKNKNGKEILLDSKQIEKNIGWNFQEKRGESPIDLYNISNSYLESSNLYIISNYFGEIALTKFTFLNGDSFKKEEKILDKYLVSAGFGNMVNRCDIKKTEENLYFNLSSGQSGTGAKDNFYNVNLSNFVPKRINFSGYTKKVKAFQIDEFGKKKYEQEKEIIDNYNKMSTEEKSKHIAPSKNEIELNNIVGNYLKNSFNYIYIDDESKLKKLEEITNIKNYSLFLKVYGDIGYSDNEKIIDEGKIKKAAKHIEDALLVSGNYKKGDQIKLLDYIYDSGQKNMIYFLYKHKLKISIILFDNYNSEWLIGDYQEEEIKQE